MTRYIFHGVVLPERADVTILNAGFNLPSEDIRVEISCLKSKIIADCNSEREENIYNLKNHIENIIRLVVDSIGFSTACGYDVEIESVYNCLTKETVIFGVHENIFQDESINKLTENGSPHPGLFVSPQDMSIISGANPDVRISLSDFREAIRNPNFTSFYCYRALDAMKNRFDGDKANQWESLRSILSVSEQQIMEVKELADDLRHGKPVSQPWDTRKRHMEFTWNCINKYVHWLKESKDNASS